MPTTQQLHWWKTKTLWCLRVFFFSRWRKRMVAHSATLVCSNLSAYKLQYRIGIGVIKSFSGCDGWHPMTSPHLSQVTFSIRPTIRHFFSDVYFTAEHLLIRWCKNYVKRKHENRFPIIQSWPNNQKGSLSKCSRTERSVWLFQFCPRHVLRYGGSRHIGRYTSSTYRNI